MYLGLYMDITGRDLVRYLRGIAPSYLYDTINEVAGNIFTSMEDIMNNDMTCYGELGENLIENGLFDLVALGWVIDFFADICLDFDEMFGDVDDDLEVILMTREKRRVLHRFTVDDIRNLVIVV